MDTNLAVPARALAVGAHPDDIEFGCGATLAKWAAQGCEVSFLICTDGSKGTWDPATDPAELVVTRRQEQHKAAGAIHPGARVVFLDWLDGELEAGLRQRFEVAAWIRRLKPQVMFGHDPWKRYRLHPDHRNAGWLVTDGIVAARDPLFFPELDAPPHRPDTLLLFEADEIDHIEDVAGFAQQKIAALLEHKSQHRSTMAISSATDGSADSDDIEDFRKRVNERLAAHGALAGLETGEAFHRMVNL